MSRTLLIAGTASLACAAMVQAEDHRELRPHQHGHGELNIAVEGNIVKMDLEVPGDDIVGFEHAPSTAEEKSLAESAKVKLAAPFALFTVPAAAKCSVTEAKVTIQEEKHDPGEESEKETNGKIAHHDEFFVEYALECKSASDVKSLKFAYFDSFRGAQALTVNVITPKGQSKFEATRDSPNIDLRGLM
jgi:hypothetical protein